jgi:hypothetical protein
MREILLIVCVLSVLNCNIVVAEQDVCEQHFRNIPIKSITASASIWSNYRNKPGSINFESNAIFHSAKDQATSLVPPANFCPKGCKQSRYAVMLFSTSPLKFRDNYSDSARCNVLYAESSKEPYVYKNTEITTIDGLNTWIGDLSQGNGEQGEDLYAKCDGSCSPRFEYTISKNENSDEKYTVQASIVCGPARDKDDNQYTLTAFFRWQCEKDEINSVSFNQ